MRFSYDSGIISHALPGMVVQPPIWLAWLIFSALIGYMLWEGLRRKSSSFNGTGNPFDPTYFIRPLAGEKTATVIAQWIFDEWSAHDTSATFEKTLGEVRAGINSTALPYYLVAFDTNWQPVGTVSLIENDLPSRPDLNPWLASLYVLPTHRGKGLARELVTEALEASDRLAIRPLYVFTPTLVKLLQEFGFNEVGREIFGGRPVTIMVRDMVREG